MKFTNFIFALACAASLAGSALAAGGGQKAPTPPEGGWNFQGGLDDGNIPGAFFGKYEKESLQRGFQVYLEVCSSCHGMKLLSYRNLSEKFGPFYSAEYPNANDNPLVRQIASNIEIFTGPNELNADGERFYRPATPADRFKDPYLNKVLAEASNGGAYPPDLSVMSKARSGGTSYIYALLKGYPKAEDIKARTLSDGGVENYIVFKAKLKENGEPNPNYPGGELIVPAGQYYNPYFPGDTSANWRGDPRHPPKGGFLAMAPQLADGRVTYLDGTEATIQQMSYDVAQFLSWAGEPKRQGRLELGFGAVLYLLMMTILTYLSYKVIWRNVKH